MDTPCRIWTGSLHPNGYGRVFRDGRQLLAHRVTYEAEVGPIPEGLDLDHLCRVRACVNPEHLEPVTRRVNLLRGDTIPARKAAQTHCIHGHEFTAANTYRRSNGTRACRTCMGSRSTNGARRRRAQMARG